MSGVTKNTGYVFNPEKVTKDLIDWVKQFFDQFSDDKKAVVGISGGKDSTVAAAVLCEALGRDRVIGVSIPNGVQADMSDVDKVFEHLKVKRYTVNIRAAYDSIMDQVTNEPARQSIENLPPRLRMSILYAVAQNENALVVNTCNLSEDYLGWSTKWGDAVGDFSLFADLTKTEVCQIGDALNLPKDLVHKVPSDGLCGKSDEEKFGFTYDILDKYLRGVSKPVKPVLEKINRMHLAGKHKNLHDFIPRFIYEA